MSATTVGSVAADMGQGVRVACARAWWVVAWVYRWVVSASWWWAPLALVWTGLEAAARLGLPPDAPWRNLLLWVAGLPCVVGLVWDWVEPISFHRWCAAPVRQWRWRARVRSQWKELATHAGWVSTVARTRGVRVVIEQAPGVATIMPKLGRIRLRGSTLRLLVKVRPGQTLDELAVGIPRVAAMLDAKSARFYPAGSSLSVMVIELVMADALTVPRSGVVPVGVTDPVGSHVVAGRTQGGEDWVIRLAGYHWLVVGCSGSGKGSFLWSMVAGLAPALLSGTVRLWGIDLKGGLELAMGKRLFYTTAYDLTAAIEVLKELKAVIETRQEKMRGVARDHVAKPGDPLHVLVIDEIAVLLAYGDAEQVKEAEKLLAFILTQGRALGVSVIGCGQDPRKNTMTLRDLFTMVVALRLRKASETGMVLGDDMATVAPAHKIPALAKGTAWVMDEGGTVDRVRADYWSDDAIRALAARYGSAKPRRVEEPAPEPEPDPSAVVIDSEPVQPVAKEQPAVVGVGSTSNSGRAPRSPRKPRSPRAPRAPRAGAGARTGGDAA